MELYLGSVHYYKYKKIIRIRKKECGFPIQADHMTLVRFKG